MGRKSSSLLFLEVVLYFPFCLIVQVGFDGNYPNLLILLLFFLFLCSVCVLGCAILGFLVSLLINLYIASMLLVMKHAYR